MNDPERPPLDERSFEEIKAAVHAADERHWPLLIGFQVPNFHPLNVPVPPQRPVHFQDAVVAYALDLFESEAAFYARFQTAANYPPWLSRLADRVAMKVLDALNKIEDGNPSATLWYHGTPWQEVHKTVRGALWQATNKYVQDAFKSKPAVEEVPVEMRRAAAIVPDARAMTAYGKAGVDLLSGSPLLLMAHAAAQRDHAAHAAQQRMSASVSSPSAARKMEAYMETKGLNQTEFAIAAGTTDKTIRKFRQTGKVKRSILGDIAKAMGITKEELLSQ